MNKKHKITLDLEEIDVKKAIECGFHVNWIGMESDDKYVNGTLTAGAGCGNPWIQVKYKEGDETKYYRLDVRKIMQFVIDMHVDREEFMKSRGAL